MNRENRLIRLTLIGQFPEKENHLMDKKKKTTVKPENPHIPP